MKFITHADDFGFDKDTVKATIDCFEKGALSSASIMPNMPGTRDAVEYAKNNPQFSFGVHLTYVDGLLSISNTDSISSLLDKNKTFLPSNQIRKKGLLFGLNEKHIIEETTRQIATLMDAGILISHVDSHGHIHKIPIFQRALENTLPVFNIKKVRRVQNFFVDKRKKGVMDLLNSYWGSSIASQFMTTDLFYMPAQRLDTKWADNLLLRIENFSTDMIIEIGVHPGYKEEWRKNEYDDILDFTKKASVSHDSINWNNL